MELQELLDVFGKGEAINDPEIYAGSHINNFSKAWAELPAKEEGTDLKGATRTYVFGYKSVVGAKETTDALFDKVQLKNFMEAET